MGLDEARGRARQHGRIAQQGAEEAGLLVHALDAELGQSARRALAGLGVQVASAAAITLASRES